MGNIQKNKGALTPRPILDTRTADNSSMKLIQEILNELKTKKFKFKPIRRIYIDKTGKNIELQEQIRKLYQTNQATLQNIKALKARPLGIPSFKDKIVQEALRLILNSIYEPEFAKISKNFGFRSNYGCHDAINNIKKKAKTMNYAIEGDIASAFDTVNFEKIREILSKKIDDKNILDLIDNG